VSVNIDYLRQEFISAKNNGGTEEVNFKTKNLNLWVDAPTVWIKDEDWMACVGKCEDDLTGESIFLGMDLSEKYDITALVGIIENGNYIEIITYFWIPEETVKKKIEKVPYRKWANEGYVTIVQGNTVDDDDVIEKIVELGTKYNILKLGYDEWNSKKTIVDLGKKGFDVDKKASKVTQYMSTLSEPTKTLYNLTSEKRIRHNGNPVLRWMISNVMIKRDTNNNIRIDKSKAKDKVDGVSALINAIAEYLDQGEPPVDINAVYENRKGVVEL